MTLLNAANKLYVGATAIDKVYAGSNLVWQPAVTGAPSSVWNTADASSGGFVLTNGGLTFQATIRGYRSIRGTVSHTTGKHYVEFLSGHNAADTDDPAFGLSDAGATVDYFLGNSAYQLSAFCAATTLNYAAPLVALTSNYTAGGVFPAVGDVWAFAVDLDAGKFWLARNNVWFGSGNPASGANPMFTYVAPILGQALFPAMGVRDEVSTPVWTLHAKAAAQAYPPPSGFNAWDAAAATWGPDESLYPAAAAAEGQAPSILSLGSRIGILSNGRITHIRYWRASGMVPSRTVMIWSDAGALLFSKTSTGVPGWNSEPVSPPLVVLAGATIRVAYGYAGSGADGYFGFIVSEAVHADTTNLDFISGCYHPGGSADFPDTIPGDASNYYCDVVYQQALT